MNAFYEHTSCSPLLATKNFTGATTGYRQRSFFVGDQSWLQELRRIIVAPQMGSIFNEAVRDITAKRWNGVAARRTMQ